MTKVGVLVDTSNYRLPPQVEATYQQLISDGIEAGATAAIAGMPDIVTAVNAALVPLTTAAALKAANVTPSAAKNAVTGWFHCAGFGALPSASGAVNIAAMQAAINLAHAEYIASGGVPQNVWLAPGVHLVNIVTYYNDDGSVFGIQSLKLLDGVIFRGEGTLRVVPNAYGPDSEYGVFRSPNTGLSHAGIRDITVDGNRANQVAGVQSSNISLVGKTDIEIRNVKSINANGRGIIIRSFDQMIAMTDIRYLDCFVSNSTTEGFQCSWVDGLIFRGCRAYECGGNGFDIFGDNDTPTPTSNSISVSDCYARGCAVGFFFETITDFVATNCHAWACAQVGFWTNRWHASPEGSMVGCRVGGTPVGFQVLGVTDGVSIHSCRVKGASVACIRLGDGGDVSNVDIRDNWLDTYDGAHSLVAVSGVQASKIRVRGTRTNTTNSFWFFTNTSSSPMVDVSVESPAANA